MEPVPDAAPTVCSLTRHDLTDRQRRWQALVDLAIIDIAPSEQGLRLRFRPESGVEAEVRDLAALERDCCSFADWTVAAADEAIVLDIHGGSAESVAAVQGMFTNLR
jgi:hypothetical protein